MLALVVELPARVEVVDRRVVEVLRDVDVLLPPVAALVLVVPPAAAASLRPATATIFCRSVGVARVVGPE